MKWIKKFEELSPAVIRSAGRKFIDKGHSERGFALLDKSFNMEHGVSNMWICTHQHGVSYDERKKDGNKYVPYTFSFDKSEFVLNTPDQQGNFPGSYNEEDVNNFELSQENIEKYVDEYGDNVHFGFDIRFYFSPTSETIKSLHLKQNSINLFNISVRIEGSENKDGDVKITLDRPMYKGFNTSYFGLFSDRKSAMHFLRNILPKEMKKYDDVIINLFSLTEIRTSVYNEKVLGCKLIKLNNLYRTEIPFNIAPNSSPSSNSNNKSKLYHYFFTENDITT